MAQTAGGTYYAASSELVSSWPATSLDLANQLESRFAAKASATAVGCKVYRGAAQAIPNNTFTNLLWTDESFDPNAMHSTTTNTDRLTIPTGMGGLWVASACIRFAGNATGAREIIVSANTAGNSTYINTPFTMSANVAAFSLSLVAQMSAGDYFYMYVSQNSGGNLNVEAGAGVSWFAAHRIGA